MGDLEVHRGAPVIRFYSVELVGARITPGARFPSHNAKAAAEAYVREYWEQLGRDDEVQVKVVAPNGCVTHWPVEAEERLICKARHTKRKGARRG